MRLPSFFRLRRFLLAAAVTSLVVLLPLAWQLRVRTLEQLRPAPASLNAVELLAASQKSELQTSGLQTSGLQSSGWQGPVVLLSQDGVLLSEDREQPLNLHLERPSSEMPELLVDAFLAAEDQRFFEHDGVDWRARSHALVQNLMARDGVRGASTITEQSVRILYPRPRRLWSRWLEHFEARQLERNFRKDEILEFYLNQVPYGRNRRGVAQAAQEYFGRDLSTLDAEEQLTLAVLVRSPSRLDPLRHPGRALGRVQILAHRLHEQGLLDSDELAQIGQRSLAVGSVAGAVEATHFSRFAIAELVRNESARSGGVTAARRRPVRRTTLDASLQRRVQALLEGTLEDLAAREVHDGAVLVVDHETDRVLAWVNAWGLSDHEGSYYDKVLLPRQPGSTLKPFVYALALERGWSTSTVIADAPVEQQINHGVHSYQNYSRGYYGPVRLREALGNSLNTPAIRAVRFVGPEALRQRLEAMAVTSLDQPTEFYGDGLALGNAELSLYELVGAYATLARDGRFRPLQVLSDQDHHGLHLQDSVFDPQVATLIADVLSDPGARLLEFGRGSILELPTQTAVKTGTSSDHNDAWAVGFNHRFTVGVWMGNVDRRPMNGVTGATGPGLVLRSVFAELEPRLQPEPLRLDPRLLSVEVCEESGELAGEFCPAVSEWLRASDREKKRSCPIHGDETLVQRYAQAENSRGVLPEGLGKGPAVAKDAWISPGPGLHLALDPRIPDSLESYRFEVEPAAGADFEVEWQLDGQFLARTDQPHYDWPVVAGEHSLVAVVVRAGRRQALAPVRFEVR